MDDETPNIILNGGGKAIPRKYYQQVIYDLAQHTLVKWKNTFIVSAVKCFDLFFPIDFNIPPFFASASMMCGYQDKNHNTNVPEKEN